MGRWKWGSDDVDRHESLSPVHQKSFLDFRMTPLLSGFKHLVESLVFSRSAYIHQEHHGRLSAGQVWYLCFHGLSHGRIQAVPLRSPANSTLASCTASCYFLHLSSLSIFRVPSQPAPRHWHLGLSWAHWSGHLSTKRPAVVVSSKITSRDVTRKETSGGKVSSALNKRPGTLT